MNSIRGSEEWWASVDDYSLVEGRQELRSNSRVDVEIRFDSVDLAGTSVPGRSVRWLGLDRYRISADAFRSRDMLQVDFGIRANAYVMTMWPDFAFGTGRLAGDIILSLEFDADVIPAGAATTVEIAHIYAYPGKAKVEGKFLAHEELRRVDNPLLEAQRGSTHKFLVGFRCIAASISS